MFCPPNYYVPPPPYPPPVFLDFPTALKRPPCKQCTSSLFCVTFSLLMQDFHQILSRSSKTQRKDRTGVLFYWFSLKIKYSSRLTQDPDFNKCFKHSAACTDPYSHNGFKNSHNSSFEFTYVLAPN